MNVTEGESVSLNCTIDGDGSYSWERQDGIEIENARRQVTLLSYSFVFAVLLARLLLSVLVVDNICPTHLVIFLPHHPGVSQQVSPTHPTAFPLCTCEL